MSAPRFPAPKDSLAAAFATPAVTHAEPVVHDPIEALDDAIRHIRDAGDTLHLIGDAGFHLEGGARLFSATETLGRELRSIEALLEAVLRAVSLQSKGATA